MMNVELIYANATADAKQMGQGNNYVVRFAHNEKDKNGNSLPPVFGEMILTGDAATQYGDPNSPTCIKKGQSFNVTGKLQFNNWKDKDGNDRSTMQVVPFLGREAKLGVQHSLTLNERKPKTEAAAADTTAPDAASNFDEEEAPFN